MAERFMRLDVSAEARDFEPVTIEPGVPLLDRSNANYRVLRRWLGRMIAEPQWQGETLDLFVCDEEQDRLNQVRCEPATGDDFRRIPDLKRELDELTNRIRAAKPSAKETKILDTVQRHFQKAITASGSSQGSCHFFKYRVAGNWRLVWAWGYQRKDMAPAAPLICTNPNCHHLFVRRSDGNANCPACEKSGLIPPRRSRLLIASVMALLLLLAAGTGFALRQWVWPPAVPPNGGNAPELLVTPADWSGPLGARIEYRVLLRAADGTEQNVTTSACGIAEDPRVLQFDEIGLTAHTLAPGQTPVHFYL
ncbi:MAG: hypothetical protein JJ992_04135, partial [Planctomycetes bacterium]|nr:hypothetical protein [Planctomycetota bacterium]